jgi:hypothetical protein
LGIHVNWLECYNILAVIVSIICILAIGIAFSMLQQKRHIHFAVK